MGKVDIGVNLSIKQFDGDREQVVERACQAGPDWMVLTGTDLSERKCAGNCLDRSYLTILNSH